MKWNEGIKAKNIWIYEWSGSVNWSTKCVAKEELRVSGIVTHYMLKSFQCPKVRKLQIS